MIRMRSRRARATRRWVVLWTLLLGCNAVPAGPEPGEFAVLFIGNSLTYADDLPGMLESLFELGGAGDLFVDSETASNFGLPDHWGTGQAQERIRTGGWDVVVLQQGPSATEGRPYLLEYTELFAAEIRDAGARPALYMVWPSLQRFFDFDGVLDSYRTAAEQVDGLFLPAGEAWRIAWESAPDLPLYDVGQFHPSVYGTYLAALVMYEQLSGLDPRDLPARIPSTGGAVSMDEELALLLQEAAREANARHAR